MILTLVLFASVLVGDPCLTGLMPIGEKDLLEPEDRWPAMVVADDSTRALLLTSFGYADSAGHIPAGVDVYRVAECPYTYGGAKGITLIACLVRGHDGDRDETVWLVTIGNNSVISRTIVAQLQTKCSFTYLRACEQNPDGSIGIKQLQHNFDCEEDEFKNTEQLPALRVFFTDDGILDEVFLDGQTDPILDNPSEE